ncbi:DNA-directed RNA polymerase subunit B'' [archaeon]|nr:MAG: DNA-directed RNA polymerase subunit B'' [archaeon]
MDENFVTLLNSFLKKEGMVKFQIDSYNDFITRRIPKVLSDIGTIKPKLPELGDLKIKLGEFKLGGPSVKEGDGSVRSILPIEARLRNLTYSAPMYVEMTSELNKIESSPVVVNFGDIPVMTKSKICPLSMMSEQQLVEAGEDPSDPGGYFIVNGTERILVLVEEIAPNRIIVEKVAATNVGEAARIHSEKDGYIQRHLVERKNDGTITITFANVTKLPVIKLFKALGLDKDKEIATAISTDEEVQEDFYSNLYETEATSKSEAINEIGIHIKVMQESMREERVTKLMDKYLLPHLGQNPENRMEKAMYLAKAVEKIIKLHLHKTEEDDLDHYSNKRLKICGDLMEILLRSILLGKWGLITRLTYNYQKLTKRGRLPPLQAIVESNVLTNQIVSALAIGSWVGGRTGISQRLERGSYIKTISHMRNVLSPLTSTQEHFEARELHTTQWGKLCCSETPEGATIGLRKYLAITANVTTGVPEKELKTVTDAVKKGI